MQILSILKHPIVKILHWKGRVVLMPTLSTVSCDDDTSDDKGGIMTTIAF